MLVGHYKAVSYTSKRVKESIFELKIVLLPVNWLNNHWLLACVMNLGSILNQSHDEKKESVLGK